MSGTDDLCGNCKLCCLMFDVDLGIDGLKRSNTWCQHCNLKASSKACRIYDDRPEDCRRFVCSWVQQDPLLLQAPGGAIIPKRSGMVATNGRVKLPDGREFQFYRLHFKDTGALKAIDGQYEVTSFLLSRGALVERWLAGGMPLQSTPLHPKTITDEEACYLANAIHFDEAIAAEAVSL